MEPRPTDSPPTSESPPDPHSSFRLEITLAVGYQRRRSVMGGVWESRVTTVVLLLGGIALVLLFLYFLTTLRVL